MKGTRHTLTGGTESKPLPRTVLADVPFDFRNKASRAAAVDHYKTMTMEKTREYAFPHDEASCLLLFWCWNPVIPECIEIVEAWGFTYKGLITWVKPHMGLGNYARNATEHMIVAVKGRVKRRVSARRYLTWFIAETRGHSRKPEQQYDYAEALGWPPYLELFARRRRHGWLSLGDELQSI
jgi:N6-adenosine-specific RNA methylase IME4